MARFPSPLREGEGRNGVKRRVWQNQVGCSVVSCCASCGCIVLAPAFHPTPCPLPSRGGEGVRYRIVLRFERSTRKREQGAWRRAGLVPVMRCLRIAACRHAPFASVVRRAVTGRFFTLLDRSPAACRSPHQRSRVLPRLAPCAALPRASVCSVASCDGEITAPVRGRPLSLRAAGSG